LKRVIPKTIPGEIEHHGGEAEVKVDRLIENGEKVA